MSPGQSDITPGGPAAGGSVDSLLPLVYDDLRAMAQHFLNNERPGTTIQATELVHEAYLKLAAQTSAKLRDRVHFLAVASTAMRRILVDHVRTKRRIKRGGGVANSIPMEEATVLIGNPPVDLLVLDEALTDLEKLCVRQVRIVEMRFFGGLTIDEVAGVLEVSPRTVDGDWQMARAWLRQRLEGVDQ